MSFSLWSLPGPGGRRTRVKSWADTPSLIAQIIQLTGNFELREDLGFELREDGGKEIRE